MRCADTWRWRSGGTAERCKEVTAHETWHPGRGASTHWFTAIQRYRSPRNCEPIPRAKEKKLENGTSDNSGSKDGNLKMDCSHAGWSNLRLPSLEPELSDVPFSNFLSIHSQVLRSLNPWLPCLH